MRRALATSLFAALLSLPLAVTVGVPPGSAATSTAPGAAADAYGLLVDVQLLSQQIPVAVGPVSHAAQDYPPGAANPSTDSVVSLGPVPDDASLVKHVGVLNTIAGATSNPQAVAQAEVADVSLLADAAGVPAVSADLVRGQANSGCVVAPNALGTTFVNLNVGGQPFDGTPDPNTVIDLQVARVILNEQHPAADGRGIVVNAIHVISTTTGDPLFRGDIVVSHAMSTVNCPNGAPSTGGSNPILITKTVSPETASPGTTLTYAVTIQNKATEDCLITKVIDHLPAGFTFVSTSGDLGSALDVSPPQSRPGGGLDLVLGNGHVLAKSTSLHQSFVVKVGANQAPGVYFNNVEIYCANLGNYVKGLDAPVTVPAPEPEPTTPPTQPGTSPPPPTLGEGPPPAVFAPTGSTTPSWLAALLVAAIVGTGLVARTIRS